MSKGTILHIEHVSKRFKLYHDIISGPIKELLFFWRREHYYDEFMAVRDVSFEIERGDVVGIVGPNGAGKSTLLKMICGLLPVDEGSICVNGQVTALLTLGVGVHPEFTGRENILTGGMLLGMSKSEVLRKMEGIISFAELGVYIDRPIRTYSSGMRSRLLFATAMSVDPDLLIVDEALATGDVYFVQKCESRIREICRSGATVLFVSHNLRTINTLCRRTIVLDQGRVCYDGPTEHGIEQYLKAVYRQHERTLVSKNITEAGIGTGEIMLTDAYIQVGSERSTSAKIGEPCQFILEIEATRPLEDVRWCIRLYSEKSSGVFAFVPPADMLIDGRPTSTTLSLPQGKSRIVVEFGQLALGDGKYTTDVMFFPDTQYREFSESTCYCFHPRCFSFHAVYEDPLFFGRGSLTEIPIKSIRVET